VKFLVDEASGLVKGSYEHPLDFSVSGHYIIDVPTFLGVQAADTNPSNLVTAKVNAFKVVHSALPNSFNNEFLDASAISTSLSSEYSVGPNKRVAVGPGGVVQTAQLVTSAAMAKVLVHLSVFTLAFDTSTGPGAGASRLMYNFVPGSGFAEPALSNVAVSVMNAAGNASLLAVTPGSEQAFVQSSGFTFRLRFTNNGSSRIWLSDYVVLYG